MREINRGKKYVTKGFFWLMKNQATANIYFARNFDNFTVGMIVANTNLCSNKKALKLFLQN